MNIYFILRNTFNYHVNICYYFQVLLTMIKWKPLVLSIYNSLCIKENGYYKIICYIIYKSLYNILYSLFYFIEY